MRAERTRTVWRLVLVAAVCGLLATPAMAGLTIGDTVNVSQNPPSPTPKMSVDVVSPVGVSPVDAGIFRILVDGVPMPAFCVDIHQAIDGAGLFDVKALKDAPVPGGPMGAGDAMNIMKIWSWYAGAAKTGLNAAAAQCAVWEVTDDYNLDTGQFRLLNPATVYTATKNLLAALPNMTDYTRMLALTHEEIQDWGVPVIPAPAALLLGSLGMACLGYARRRQWLS